MTEENTTPEQPQTQAPAANVPDTKAVRAQYLQEKMEALRAKQSEKKSSTDYSSKMKELEAREAKLKEQESKWKQAYEDPAKGFEALGVTPHQAYQRLTDILLDSDTPEVKQKAMLEDLKKELKGQGGPEIEALRKEIDELKKDLTGRKEAEQAEATKAAEGEQLKVFANPKFEELTDFYSEEQLLSAAYEVARMLHKSGQGYDYDSVAQKMLDIHTNWWDNVTKKRASKQAPPSEQSESESGSAYSGGKESKAPKAIGNSVASATASSPERSKDKATRQKERAKLLKGLFEE